MEFQYMSATELVLTTSQPTLLRKYPSPTFINDTASYIIEIVSEERQLVEEQTYITEFDYPPCYLWNKTWNFNICQVVTCQPTSLWKYIWSAEQQCSLQDKQNLLINNDLWLTIQPSQSELK